MSLQRKILLGFCFLISCNFLSQTWQNKSTLHNINQDSAVKKICSSLKKNKVDTIIIFRKYCIDCFTRVGGEPGHKKDLQSPDSLGNEVLRKNSTPSYIFWIESGHYFVKKIDQLAIYKTIERAKKFQYPLYDYAIKNRQRILNETHLYKSTQLYPDKKPEIYYALLTEKFDAEQSTDATKIVFLIKKDSVLNITFNHNESMPIENTLDSLRNSNSLRTYYYNLVLERNHWKRIIESELFETEFKHLWIKE